MNTEIIETKSEVLKDLVRIIGYSKAEELLMAVGGSRLYIKKDIGHDDKITEVIGLTLAKLLATTFGGDRLEFPMLKTLKQAKQTAEVKARASDGATVAELVEEFGIYKRKIRHILSN